MKGNLRFVSLLLVLSCLLLPLSGLAAAPQDMSISVQWVDAYGETQISDPAVPVTDARDETRFWITLPPDAPLYGLTLNIADLTGSMVSFLPGQGELLENVVDAMGLLTQPCVQIIGFGAAGEVQAMYYLYLSTQPLSEQPANLPAIVTVHYTDDYGQPLLENQVLELEQGVHTVSAQQIPGYRLISPESFTVTVDGGVASPSDITFAYEKAAVTAQVTVRYVDENGVSLVPDQVLSLEQGATEITALLLPGYDLMGDSVYTVVVDAYGASLSEITFHYVRRVITGTVTVHYVDENGYTLLDDQTVTLNEGVSNVYAASIEHYELTGADAFAVTVDQDGVRPAEVTFTYARIIPTAQVTVHYVDESGMTLMSDMVYTLDEGQHVLSADPIDGYEIMGSAQYAVTVDYSGASPAEITFVYARIIYPAVVTVRYVDTQGNPVADETAKLFEGGTYAIFPQPENLPPRYFQAAGDPEFQNVTIDADGAHPDTVVFVYEYRSADPVTLPVFYRDIDSGADVALAGSVTLPPDAVTAVTAQPESLLPNYVPAGDTTVNVSVNVNGEADRSEIIFFYRYVEPTPTPTPEPTPEPTPTPAPVMVTVRYVDENGMDVATPGQVWCGLGDTQIDAAPADLAEGYVPDGPQSALVHVDENGPQPAEVLFTYRLYVEPPAPKVALVNVKYLSPDKVPFYTYSATCVEGQENRVDVDWSQVDPSLGYELASDATVYVTVDENGTATPAEVIFRFREEINVYVTVRYVDQATGRDVATPQTHPCYEGANTVDCAPQDLDPNYVAVPGTGPVTVTLDAEGRLNPAEVVFLFTSIATATPAPQIPTYDVAMDTYCYPTGASVRLRSTPTAAEDNILGFVSTGDLGHVLGRVTNADGKTWYAVEIKGMTGYLSESVVRLLSDAEIAELFHYTAAPTQEPTPRPTAIPDGSPIDRWGTTTTSVNFRRDPGKNGKKITELRKNIKVWIYSSTTVDGETWYSVRYNGTDGYVMASYVQMASQEESDAIQAQLPTPMATQTPNGAAATPSPEPTLEPTAEPVPETTAEPAPEVTPVPTEAPAAPTETPAAYRGYALTNTQAALRTGVSMTDDSILEMLPPETLMLVNGQTYVNGEAWASAQSLASGSLGFILQSALTPISAEEARAYMDRLQPTSAPTEVPLENVEGYAMTLGSGVPMRNFPDTNGEIITLLPYKAVAYVRGQQYVGNTAWHLVQYNGMWGYIRQDQLRMMSEEESLAYEAELAAGTPTPSAAPASTPEPVTQDSLSSYGYVKSSSGRVNLRTEPTTKKSNAIRLLDNYAFALVLGSVTNEEGTWYHISQGGYEGYIRGDYFHVLTLGELSEFLQSSEYLNANSNNANGGSSSSEIQAVEDYNNVVWQNPAISVSYEPFNPFATPTPDPERLPTQTPTPAPTPTPTPEIAPVTPQDGGLQPDNTKQAGSPWPWVLLGLAIVGGGGAYYAYVRRQNEKRRQALRAQQAREARSAAANQPQMRAAQNNPGQNPPRPAYPNQSAPFIPPAGSAPKPGQAASWPAGTEENSAQPVRQDTQTYQPNRPAAVSSQATQTYQPPRGAKTGTPLSQDTQSFRPAPIDPNAQRMNLNIRTARPEMEELPIEPMGAKPAIQPIAPQTPVQPEAETPAAAPQAEETAGQTPEQTAKRVRRTERNKGLYDD